MKLHDVTGCSLFKVNTLNDVDPCIRMLLIAFFLFSVYLIVYYSVGVHSDLVNTLVDVSPKKKKINFCGNRKKLQLLNYFKGESSQFSF